VLGEMADLGDQRLTLLNAPRVLLLAALGGGFITMGALFSVLLGAGTDNEGLVRILEGVGFSAGFFFVILSGAVLFTEANVVLPATLLHTRKAARRIARFWALAWIGNFAGALLFSAMVAFAINYTSAVNELLHPVVDAKVSFRAEGGVDSWLRVVVSGVLANWLVGMAAFFALMSRTIFGKYIPVLLASRSSSQPGFSTARRTWATSRSSWPRRTVQAGGTRWPGTSSRPESATCWAAHCWLPFRSSMRSDATQATRVGDGDRREARLATRRSRAASHETLTSPARARRPDIARCGLRQLFNRFLS
jgi:hypothetical protein